ncbi:hypothetical protein ABPG72_007963 [Tetrahymena utriculariae]
MKYKSFSYLMLHRLNLITQADNIYRHKCCMHIQINPQSTFNYFKEFIKQQKNIELIKEFQQKNEKKIGTPNNFCVNYFQKMQQESMKLIQNNKIIIIEQN